ncbi:MAG: sulfotransferase [Bacteroidota bacterium]|nr:sulfotransferase [Bacteroidota bacterium]
MKVAKHVKTPNFFIIGAPKCGTTALSEYLRKHPDIHFSYPKEPDYFNTDFSDENREFKNYNYHSKSKYLARLIHNLGYKFAWILLVKKKLGIPEGISILGPIKRFNSVKSSRKKMDTAFREKLKVEFREDVSLLEKLLNRDLSHWK